MFLTTIAIILLSFRYFTDGLENSMILPTVTEYMNTRFNAQCGEKVTMFQNPSRGISLEKFWKIFFVWKWPETSKKSKNIKKIFRNFRGFETPCRTVVCAVRIVHFSIESYWGNKCTLGQQKRPCLRIHPGKPETVTISYQNFDLYPLWNWYFL